jgi:outer membrane protein assembly factor BamB
VVADTIYVATYDQTGAIQYYLTAYDLASGKPIWRRLICSSQLEVNMFGNAQHEFAAAPLTFEGGVLYATTNLGVCYAVDAQDGRIRWISAYDTIPMPATQLSGQMPRPVVFANAPGVVLEDVFVCTPLDSFSALAFDTNNGKLAWRMLYQAQAESSNNDIQWLLGALGDEVIFSGRGVVAVQATRRPSPARRSRASSPRPSGSRRTSRRSPRVARWPAA